MLAKRYTLTIDRNNHKKNTDVTDKTSKPAKLSTNIKGIKCLNEKMVLANLRW